MKVKIAKSAGFCFGVERAYELVQKSLEEKSKTKKLSTFGPLIHNNRVMEELAKDEVNILEDAENAEGVVIVRSHGTSEQNKKVLEKKASQLIDATCPFVTRVDVTAKRFENDGRLVVIVGDKNHPEMQGIIANLQNPFCVETLEEAESLDQFDPNLKLGVVCQTTLRREKFEEIAQVLKLKSSDCIIDDTICSATVDRQTAIRELAQEVDFVVVLGGKQSSNTKKLAAIAEEFCPTQKIEYVEELDLEALKDVKVVGVSAGASTPQNQINELVEFLKQL